MRSYLDDDFDFLRLDFYIQDDLGILADKYV